MRRYWYWGGTAVLGTAGLLLGLVLTIPLQTAQYIYSDLESIPRAQVAMVPGAAVFQNGDLSAVLKERADRAVALYASGKVSKILVTGDNSDLSHNEVNPVGKYLVTSGVPKSDIFLDHAGFDTYSSMYRARDVFGVSSVIVVSQHFHLARAVLIARKLGLKAYGEQAGGSTYFYNTLREIPATVKALSDLTFERMPKYLGQQYPITGDGTATWE